jgi:hypothetical protein
MWTMLDGGEVTNNELRELRNICFRNLVFYLNENQINQIYNQINSIDETSHDTAMMAVAGITHILKNSLNEEESVKSTNLLKLFNAFKKEGSKDSIVIVKEEKTLIDKVVEENNKSDEMSPSITFWHFIMWRDTEQLKAFENKNWLLCLIEYGEDWRTNMLDQVQPNDVIFLFRRGGYGYIGAFRAKGKKIYTNEEWYKLDEGKRKEIAFYDMYNAFEDGATSVANVLVEPIAYNFKGVGYYTVRRRTIERMNDMEAVKFLLTRFNGKDLDNNCLAGKGKLDNNTNIENLINKNYFSEIIRQIQ